MPRPRKHPLQVPGQPVSAHPLPAPLAGKGDDDVLIDIAGKQVPLNEIIQSAYESAALSYEEWQALPGHERDELIGAKQKELAQQFRDAPVIDPEQQAEVQRRAAAAVAARKAARAMAPDTPEAVSARLPHSSTVTADKHKAIQCSDGWLAPTPDPLPVKHL